MERNKLFGWAGIVDLIVLVVIALISLVIAYVTFGILESQAQAEIQKYSISGALVGAVVVINLLTSTYLQLRKSSGELEALRARNEELQQKVIRGAPHPMGYEIEVSERQRIVLARPKDWKLHGGTIFDFELPEKQIAKGDIFPARFMCLYEMIAGESKPAHKSYENIDEKSKRARKFYENIIDEAITTNKFVESYTSEYVHLGGESCNIESLKIIAHEYGKTRMIKNNILGRIEPEFLQISKDEFDRLVAEENSKRSDKAPSEQSLVTSSTDEAITKLDAINQENYWPFRFVHMRVICYHIELGVIFFFDFLDDEKNFTQSSLVFNQILMSARFLN